MNDLTITKATISISDDTRYLTALLSCRTVPGSPEEISRFRIRIDELMRINGEAWVRANARHLLAQWAASLRMGAEGRQG